MTTAASKPSKKILSGQLRQLRGEVVSDVWTGSVVVLQQHVCVCEKACKNCKTIFGSHPPLQKMPLH